MKILEQTVTKVIPNPIHGDGHNITQINGFLWPCRCYSPSKIVTSLFLDSSPTSSLPEEKCDINILKVSNFLVHMFDEQCSIWWQMCYILMLG